VNASPLQVTVVLSVHEQGAAADAFGAGRIEVRSTTKTAMTAAKYCPRKCLCTICFFYSMKLSIAFSVLKLNVLIAENRIRGSFGSCIKMLHSSLITLLIGYIVRQNA
jgi:hypothetical protein